MKRLPLFLLICALLSPLHGAEKGAGKKMIPRFNTLSKKWVSYAASTIHDIQFVPLDSLKKADTIQNSNVSRASLQYSPLLGDTVVITGLVVTPCAADSPHSGITFTQHGWTMLLHDTAANSNSWGGILVRVGSTITNPGPDTAQAFLDGFKNPKKGDIIQITGWIEEFPDNLMNSTTQFRPYPGIHVDVSPIHNNPIPAPTLLNVSDFYLGGYPGGTIKFSTGEQYEGSLVKLTHLTVNSLVNTTRGTWAMTDQFGNYLADLDASHFFTLGNETPNIPGAASFHTIWDSLAVGSVIDSIKGTIMSNSGTENPRGYRICPLFVGDVKFGISLPTVITHRRFPVIPKSTDSVRVHAVVKRTPGGRAIQRASLIYSVENGPWIADSMIMISPDSTYEAVILDIDGNPLAANTHVKYFIKALDVLGNSNILANASSAFQGDTSKGFFFYQVLDRPVTIYDLQYTPYPNGRGPYTGAVATVAGVVTASGTEIDVTPLNSGGTSAWYIQNGNTPWNGIWVVKDTANHPPLDSVKLGDSITVTGTVQESFGNVTRIFDSVVTINAHNRPLPNPLLVTTGTFGLRGDGDPVAEPYEGVLIKVVNATVDNVTPIFSDSTEWQVNDGSGGMLVRMDGKNSYGNQETDTSGLGKSRIVHVGDKVDTLVGVAWFSFGRYKIEPRTNRDFVVGEPYLYDNNWNIVSVAKKQLPASTGYRVDSLYPGRTSPAFSYSGSYNLSPVLSTGVGYWIKFNGARMIPMLGLKTTLDTIHILSGWNLIGTLSNPVTTSSIVTNPGNHLGKFFGYSGAYGTATTLTPSRGYWVKADSNGYLVESAPWNLPKAEPSLAANFNSLKITDRDGNSQTLYFGQDAQGKIALRDYELPPSGPVEGFDMRYGSGRILETYPVIVREGRNFAINLKATTGPLTVSWRIVTKDGKHFTLTDAENGKRIKPLPLAGSGTSIGLKTGVEKLFLRVDGGPAIPMEYSLGQNYPNPFNPTTTFMVGLPEAARLQVVVYDVLGRKVVTLVDDVRDAGYYPVTWNSNAQDGNAVSSGVYFVRMNAEKFTAVHKIMLLK